MQHFNRTLSSFFKLIRISKRSSSVAVLRAFRLWNAEYYVYPPQKSLPSPIQKIKKDPYPQIDNSEVVDRSPRCDRSESRGYYESTLKKEGLREVNWGRGNYGDINKISYCYDCRPEKQFNTERKCIDHFIEDHSARDGTFCTICHKNLHLKNFRFHFRQSHVRSHQQCSNCGRVLKNFLALSQHMYKSHGGFIMTGKRGRPRETYKARYPVEKQSRNEYLDDSEWLDEPIRTRRGTELTEQYRDAPPLDFKWEDDQESSFDVFNSDSDIYEVEYAPVAELDATSKPQDIREEPALPDKHDVDEAEIKELVSRSPPTFSAKKKERYRCTCGGEYSTLVGFLYHQKSCASR